MNDIKPEDVFRLATKNPVLNAALTCFKMGSLTWDKAMMVAAVMLAEENEKLRESLILNFNQATKTFITKKGE